MNPFALQRQIEPIESLENFFKSEPQTIDEVLDIEPADSIGGLNEAVGLETFFYSGGK